MKNYSKLIKELVNARKRKGWSQIVLSKKSLLPQSHISKIENSKTDMRISSLIELARLLDHDVIIVPKDKLSLIEALSNNSDQDILSEPMYKIDDE